MNIRLSALVLAVTFAVPAIAHATTPSCKLVGLVYKCDVAGDTFNVTNAPSAEAAAAAVAAAVAEQAQSQNQGQQQGQQQGQTSSNSNDNSNSSSISNTIEGNPKHTTSMNLGVGINFSVPIASGVQTKNAIDSANWFMQNGQSCVAYAIMAKAPRVRNLKININCGDKG